MAFTAYAQDFSFRANPYQRFNQVFISASVVSLSIVAAAGAGTLTAHAALAATPGQLTVTALAPTVTGALSLSVSPATLTLSVPTADIFGGSTEASRAEMCRYYTFWSCVWRDPDTWP